MKTKKILFNLRNMLFTTKTVTKKRFASFILILLTFFWFFQMFYFALVTKHGIPPDEAGHFSLIKKFQNSMKIPLTEQGPEYNLGSSNRIPSLYHFFMGKLLHLNFFTNDYLFLRVVNILMSFAFLYYCWKFINLLVKSDLTKIFFFVLFFHTVMLSFLFASINYDNFVNVFSIISLYHFVAFIKFNRRENFLKLITVGLLGCLTKFTFLPLFLIETLMLLIFNRKSLFSLFKKKILVRKEKIQGVFIVFLVIISFYFWGVNLIRYKTPMPSCNQLLPEEECLKNGVYRRRYTLWLEKEIPVSLEKIVSYFDSWKIAMISNSLGIMSHDSVGISEEFIYFFYFFLLFGFLISFKAIKFKGNYVDLTLLLIISFYTLVVFWENFQGYRKTGLLYIAVQGRYLFPVIVPLYYLISKYVLLFLRKKTLKVLFVFIFFALLNQYTFRDIVHCSLFKKDSYNQKPELTNLVIKAVYGIPRIRLFYEENEN